MSPSSCPVKPVCPAAEAAARPSSSSSRDAHSMDDPTCHRLILHYDRKYANRPALLPAIRLRRNPTNRYEAAVKWAGIGRRALDVGAGSGELVRALRAAYGEWAATELSFSRAAGLKETFRDDPSVQVLQHDIERGVLPFPQSHFDAVLLIDVIEHLVDPVPALIEIRRVLRPAGRLLVHTPNIAKWTRRVKLLSGRFPSTASCDEGLLCHDGKTPTDMYDEGHLHYFTYRSLTRLLRERAGFARVVAHGYGTLWPLCRLWPTLFSDVFVIAVK